MVPLRSRNPLVSLLACLLICPSVVWAQQDAYYVSPTGDDANPGTEAKPFKTIQKARDEIRGHNQNMSQDITVYLRGGKYELDETLLLEPRDSGTNGHKVIYRNYRGETPSLDGGKRISGWQNDSGNRWKASTGLADFRQLYVDGKRGVRARGGRLPAAELYGRDGYKTSEVAMAGWKNQSDIEFVYDVEWERTICKVAQITREGTSALITMQQPYFTLARLKGGVQDSFPTYVENAFELLNEPGEWYFDRTAHAVYYIPRPGEDMTTTEIVAPAVEKLLELRGTLDASVQNLVFEGIRFCHASWLRPSQIGHVDVQANFVITPENLIARSGLNVDNLHNENIKSPSSVVLHAAKSIRFEGCTFTQFGSGGIDLEYGSQDNVIEGNRFYDLAGSAIQVGDVIDHHPRDSREIVKGNRIVNNYIHDVAVEYKAGVGIFLGYTDGTVIAHNEISNLPYSGISAGWGWGEEDAGGGDPHYFQPFFYKDATPSRNMTCEYNHIHNVMLERNDGGGIYTTGNMPGTVIRGNLIHDNVGRPGGVYLDEGSAYIEVTGNTVYNVWRAMNYNNRAQNRIATCHEHDNYFDVTPGEPRFPKDVAGKAGLEPQFRNLLATEPAK